MSYSDLQSNENSSPAGMLLNLENLASKAINLIQNLIRNSEKGISISPIAIQVNSEWKDGNTLKSRNIDSQKLQVAA